LVEELQQAVGGFLAGGEFGNFVVVLVVFLLFIFCVFAGHDTSTSE
jgi:hypothetical protein